MDFKGGLSDEKGWINGVCTGKWDGIDALDRGVWIGDWLFQVSTL